eukprot:4416036-Alexandrium_andersonii.AAC.1
MPSVRPHAAATTAIGAPATTAAVSATNEAPVEGSDQDAHAEPHKLEPFNTVRCCSWFEPRGTTCCCQARPGSMA